MSSCPRLWSGKLSAIFAVDENLSDAIVRIKNYQAVTSYFGFWPWFHDAEVLRVEMARTDSGPALAMDVHVFHLFSEPDERGSHKLLKQCVVSFLCRNVDDVELVDFNHQNVIFSLAVDHQGERLCVTLSPCYGLSGRFTCGEMEVVGLKEILKPNQTPPMS